MERTEKEVDIGINLWDPTKMRDIEQGHYFGFVHIFGPFIRIHILWTSCSLD